MASIDGKLRFYMLQNSIVKNLSVQSQKTLPESLLFFFVAMDNRSLPVSYDEFEAAISILRKEGRIVINDEEYDEPEITLVRRGTA